MLYTQYARGLHAGRQDAQFADDRDPIYLNWEVGEDGKHHHYDVNYNRGYIDGWLEIRQDLPTDI